MRLGSTILLAAALLGCGRPRPGDAPTVRLGSDPCARCGMIVSEERFAAGYVGDDGGSVVYDDLGEMLAALDERPELRGRAWVRDMKDGGWLRLKDAHAVRVPGLATPMGSGWIAFARQADAEAFARERARR